MPLTELRYAFRALWRTPTFTVIAVATLALGIGATAAIFAVVNGVLIRSLPYPDPDRIVSVQTRFPEEGRQIPRATGGDWEDLRQHSAFAAAASYYGGEMGVELGDRAEFQHVYFVTPRFFSVFGIQPAFGRDLREADAKQSAVVSESFARQHYGSPAAALGKRLSVEKHSYELVGVMPGGFHFPENADIWLSVAEKAENLSRTAYNYRPIARVSPSIGVDVANQQMEALGADLARRFADSNAHKTFSLVPLKEQLSSGSRTTLLLLLGAVGLMMLIGCVNVANLFLTRATSRVREMAIRGAMGAARWQVMRQLLLECFLIAGAACSIGVGLAQFATASLLRFLPNGVQGAGEVHVDLTVLAFAAGLAVLSVLVFGIAPAWQATRVDLREGLLQNGNRGALGGRFGWLRGALVCTEITFAVLLVLGAGLLFRTMLALNQSDLGIRSEGVLVMVTHEPAGTKDEYTRVARSLSELREELKAIPGVRSAAAVMGLPTGQYGSNGSYAVQGVHSFDQAEKLPHALFALASPDYFETMGIRLLRGRDIQPGDLYEAPFVAVISESLARQSFGEKDPIGQQLVCGLDSATPMTIVGVVSDVRQASPSAPPEPHLYMPLAQHPYFANEVQVVMRSDGDPNALIPEVRRRMLERSTSTSIRFSTMPEMVSESVAMPRFRWFLTSIFAGLSLLLAVAGIYGVMSYAARQRQGEMGLRVALGAQPGDVWRLFLAGAAKLGVAGLAMGLFLSLLTGKLLSGMLYGVESVDLLTYAMVVLVVGLAVTAAAAVPAQRAARVDPMVALREE